VREPLFGASALLQGRPTFLGLAGAWPLITDDSGFADRVNSIGKHVASTSLTEPLPWDGTLLTGGRGPVWIEPFEAKRYESGVTMLRYRPAGR
jgi:hypothetical protein